MWGEGLYISQLESACGICRELYTGWYDHTMYFLFFWGGSVQVLSTYNICLLGICGRALFILLVVALTLAVLLRAEPTFN